MEKSILKQTILRSYQSLEPNDFNDLDTILSRLESECNDASEMAKKFGEMPEYKLLNESFIRKKTEQMRSNSSTIMIITVIYFVCSVISAIYLADKLL